MKKLCLFAACLAFCTFIAAQSPQAIPYQAVVRDTTGTPIPNQHMQTRFTVHDSIATGAVVYQETDTFTTSSLGLFTVNVGRGTVVSGVFSAINWASNPMFLQVEIDPTGGTSFVNMGTAQLMSVPYALYAGSSATPVPSGMVLLGKLIGANMNSAGSYTLNLTRMSGTFYTGELITADNGSTAQVVSISDTTMIANNSTGPFSVAAPLDSLRRLYMGITGQYALVTYTSLVDTFQAGEGVWDLANDNTGTILTDNGSNTMEIGNTSGNMSPGDTIQGVVSGATAVVATFSPPASASIASASFSGGDQAFTLSGGSTIMATHIVFTNASGSVYNANDPEIWTGASRTGSPVFNISQNSNNTLSGIGALQGQQSASPFIRLIAPSSAYACSASYFDTYSGGSLYFSLGTAQGSAATLDIYVYGFILH